MSSDVTQFASRSAGIIHLEACSSLVRNTPLSLCCGFSLSSAPLSPPLALHRWLWFTFPFSLWHWHQ
jgi:hypothetical protein